MATAILQKQTPARTHVRATEAQQADGQCALPLKISLPLLLLVLVGLSPLFVAMPVTSDVALFDLQAKNLLEGGTLYRDILEPNLPGVVWFHAVFRSLVGWSSEAVRILDLTMLSLTLICLSAVASYAGRPDRSRQMTGGILLAGFLFYFSMNEWCHCQRDTWMLLPAAAALWMRVRGTNSLTANASRFLEGVMWGCAIWLKPFVIIAALPVLLLDLAHPPARRRSLAEFVWLMIGGLVTGLLGVLWMMDTGAWPHFLETATEWNPEYFAAGRSRWSIGRVQMMLMRFGPWWTLHLGAIPVAIAGLVPIATSFVRRCNGTSTPGSNPTAEQSARGLIAAFYIGWMLQSIFLQHLMDYIHVPGVLLAIVLLATAEWNIRPSLRQLIICGFLVVAILSSSLIQQHRLRTWRVAVEHGSTDEMRNVLSDANYPDWQHLHAVEQFLSQQGVSGTDVTCFNVHSNHIYNDLSLQPSTRYVGLSSLLSLFPSRQHEIMDAVHSSGHRFVVTELRESRISAAELESSPESLPQFPWQLPVVFESGSYRVHEVRRLPVRS